MEGRMWTRDQARLLFSGFAIVSGAVFLLAPRSSLRLYGLDPEQDGAAFVLRYVGRVSLFVGVLAANEDTGEAVLRQLPVLALTDGVACAAGLLRGEITKRTALLAALTSVAALAAGIKGRH
jgi:hypothetical protein